MGLKEVVPIYYEHGVCPKEGINYLAMEYIEESLEEYVMKKVRVSNEEIFGEMIDALE